MSEKRKTGWGLKIFLALAVLFFIGVVITPGDEKTEDSKETKTVPTTIDTVKKTIEAPSEKQNWNVFEESDAMSGRKMYFTTTKSINKVDFEFPYDGGSTMTITIRNMGKRNEVALSISKGQFMTSIGDDYKIRVKFDNGKVVAYPYNSASNGSSKVIFPKWSSNFIKQLKKAKKLMIEAPFYDSGRKIFNFNVSGFKWNH